MAEGFYDTGQANPVFRICRSKVPCGPQADANAGRDHCEPLRRRDATLTLEALLAGAGTPAAAATAAAPPPPAKATTPGLVRPPPTAGVPFLGGRSVPQPRRFYSSGAATPKTPLGTVTRTVSPVGQENEQADAHV